MTSYVTIQNPSKYGGKQDDYLWQASAIINECAIRFRKAEENNSDLIRLFHETLDFLGKERRRIANEHKTTNWEQFGIRRDGDLFQGPTAITFLNYEYEKYGNRLLSTLQKNLSNMGHTFREFQQKTLQVNYASVLNRAFASQYSIKFSDDFFIQSNRKEWERLSRLASFTLPEGSNEDLLHALISNRDALQVLKKNSLQDYQKIKLSLAAVEAYKRFYEWRKSDWVFVTNRLQVNDKMYAVTQYFTWMYRTFEEDPVEHMSGRAVVGLIHQDPFLIKPMLDDIAKLFKKAVEWNRQDFAIFKNTVALLQYEFAHAMPFLRGSAAISEWLEKAIYQSHGFEMSYAPDKFPNLEALTLPLSDFVNNYDSLIKLK